MKITSDEELERLLGVYAISDARFWATRAEIERRKEAREDLFSDFGDDNHETRTT
jgi:hypothetical protein